jgi:hypothetical protein
MQSMQKIWSICAYEFDGVFPLERARRCSSAPAIPVNIKEPAHQLTLSPTPFIVFFFVVFFANRPRTRDWNKRGPKLFVISELITDINLTITMQFSCRGASTPLAALPVIVIGCVTECYDSLKGPQAMGLW